LVSSSHGIVSLQANRVFGRNELLDRYFYFSMSLLAAAIVVGGFSSQIDSNRASLAIIWVVFASPVIVPEQRRQFQWVPNCLRSVHRIYLRPASTPSRGYRRITFPVG
jgi:hypothetical protein